MSKKGFESPNHTQVPNDLFDVHLPTLGHAELKVLLIIVRQTLGWQRRKSHVSRSFLEDATGLSRRAVRKACESLASSDLLERTKDKEGYEWEIIWNDPPYIGAKGGVVSTPEQMLGGVESIPGGDSKYPPSTQEGGAVSTPKERKKERTTNKEDEDSVLKESDQDTWTRILQFVKLDRYRETYQVRDGEFQKFWMATGFGRQKDGKYLIACDTKVTRDWLQSHGQDVAEHYLFGVLQEHVEVEFVVEEQC